MKKTLRGKIEDIDDSYIWIHFPRFPYRINLPIRKRYEIEGTHIEVEKGDLIELVVKKPKKKVV